MTPNPIPLTLALAPFDRLEIVDKVSAKYYAAIVARDESRANDASFKVRIGGPFVSNYTKDLQAEVDALSALLDLARDSTGDTIFLSTHAYSLLA